MNIRAADEPREAEIRKPRNEAEILATIETVDHRRRGREAEREALLRRIAGEPDRAERAALKRRVSAIGEAIRDDDVIATNLRLRLRRMQTNAALVARGGVALDREY